MGTGWRRAFCTTISRDPAETTSSASSILEHKHQQQQQQQSPIPSSRRSYVKLGIGGIFSSGSGGGGGSSNPSTPRLHSTNSTPRCQTTTPSPPTFESESPRVLQCKTTTTKLPSADAAAAAATTPTSLSSSSSIKSNNSKGSLSPRLFRSSSPRSPSRFALLKTALRLSRNRCGICGESVRTGDQRTAVFTAECSHAFHFPCISSHVRTQGSLVCPICSATWHEVPLLSSSLHLPSAAAAAAGQFLGSRERSSNNRRGGERERAAPAVGTTKIYDDDESLQLCSTSRIGVGVLQFNPIPEELEAEDDDDVDADEDHEGQGQGEDDCEQGHHSDCIHQIISVVPDSMALVSNGRNHLNYVVSIRVKAPRLPPQSQAAAAATSVKKHDIAASIAIPPSLLDHPSCRAPIDLVTVLDVSGSMTVAKLQILKRAMRLVISSLGPGDRLSIVAFSMAAAKRLFPLRRMSRLGQRSSRQVVDRLVICGSSQVQAQGQDQSDHCLSKSCMGDALRKATKVLEDRRERNPVATIMLLSDGHSHGHGQERQQEQNVHGTCTTNSSRSQGQQPSSATRFTHIEIPIHASGSQKQGASLKNNNVPVEEENAFAKHVNGLVSVVLQDVHLQFSFPSASGVISSVYSYPHGGECGDICGIGQAMSHGEGGKSVFLGDLYAEEEMQLLVELKVPKATVLGGHAISISLKCSYRDPLTREVIHSGERPLSMPMPMSLHSQEFPILLRSSSSSSSRAGAASMTTQQQQQQLLLRNIFVTTRAMAESRRLVELSDLDTALHLLSSARSLLLQQSAAVSNTHKKLVLSLEAQLEDLQKQQKQKKQQQRRWQPQPQSVSPSQRRISEQALLAESRGGGEPLTPTSAWRAAEQLAKVAIMRKSLNRVSDLHGLENARF